MWILDETSLSIIFGCTFQLMIPGGTCHLTKVVTLTIREKVVIGIMQKNPFKTVNGFSITVKNLLQGDQFAKRSTSINE